MTGARAWHATRVHRTPTMRAGPASRWSGCPRADLPVRSLKGRTFDRLCLKPHSLAAALRLTSHVAHLVQVGHFGSGLLQPAQYSLLAVVRFQEPHHGACVLQGASYERALPVSVQSDFDVRLVPLDHEAFLQASQMIDSRYHRRPGRMAHLVPVGGFVVQVEVAAGSDAGALGWLLTAPEITPLADSRCEI